MKKLLALLCVVALLGALCVPVMATEEFVPVAAEVPADWTTVYLYAWGDNGDISPWPGVPMTNVDGWWCAYMPNDMANIIINNGSGIQTGDLAVEVGMPVCVMMANGISDPDVGFELPIEFPSVDELGAVTPSAGEKATIHAKTPEDWESCTLYAWGDAGDNGGWPGAEMTLGDDGLWTAELAPMYANIIIAGNAGGVQTVDLSYAGGECWVVLQEQDAGGKYTAAVVYEEPTDYDNVQSTPAPVPTSDVWYVAGTMNDWNCADEGYKMTANGDGTFTFTFSITAGSHALKVTNGTWDVSFGGTGADGNFEFTAAADGEVTVNYDGNGVVTVSGDGITEGGSPEPVPVTGPLYVAGTMNDWNCADEAYKMTDNGDGTHTITFALTAGAHSLKVTNGTWDVSFGGDGENGNYDFEVAADGNVTVTFDGTAVSVAEGGAATEPTEAPTTAAPTDATTGNTNTTDNGGDNSLVIGIVVAVLAVIVGAVAVFFILKKK